MAPAIPIGRGSASCLGGDSVARAVLALVGSRLKILERLEKASTIHEYAKS
jgi:hypothetical protein